MRTPHGSTKELLDLAAIPSSDRHSHELLVRVQHLGALAIRAYLHGGRDVQDLEGVAGNDHLHNHVVNDQRFTVGHPQALRFGIDQSADEPHGAVAFVEGLGFVTAMVDRNGSTHIAKLSPHPRQR